MAKWEYAMYHAGTIMYVGNDTTAEAIYTNKDSTGRSSWDVINEYGKNGWELVSTCSINDYVKSGATYTIEVVFFFKRPLE